VAKALAEGPALHVHSRAIVKSSLAFLFVVLLGTLFVTERAYAQELAPLPTETQPAPPAATAPAATDARPPIVYGPVPPPKPRWREEVREFSPHRPLFIVGAVGFFGAYMNGVMIGAMSDRDADHWLFIPVVGSWIDLFNRQCSKDPCADIEPGRKALLVFNGISQALGLGAIVTSLFVPEVVRTKVQIVIAPVSGVRGAF
jgi:hypothetical protein